MMLIIAFAMTSLNLNRALWLALLLTVPWFFIGSVDSTSSRLVEALWNFGHMLFFAIATWLLLQHSDWLARKSFAGQLLWVLLLASAVGGGIELLQASTQRLADIEDLKKDIVGALLMMAFYAPARLSLKPLALTWLQCSVLALLSLSVYSLAAVAWDEWRTTADLPMLASFESSLELGRWRGNGNSTIARTSEQASEGDYGLSVVLGRRKYSGVVLHSPAADWRGYQRLGVDIYNPSAQPLEINLRINDQRHHQGGQLYSDRYRQKFILVPGWNYLSIDLIAVAAAPVSRPMEMAAITKLMFYVMRQTERKTIVLDNLRLER